MLNTIDVQSQIDRLETIAETLEEDEIDLATAKQLRTEIDE
ncbi:MAG: hypothetical protein J07HX5_00428 [halophilic archaeon J07HX5]|nr:MAG: hypothetical protein J07HX5_00428 [halophilic archaeon J07HX5]